MEYSYKIVLLFSIVAQCEIVKDKILVFSQSLKTLDLIEKYLQMIDENTKNSNPNLKLGFKGCWTRGLDYFRLDGRTKIDERDNICKLCNDPSNSRAR